MGTRAANTGGKITRRHNYMTPLQMKKALRSLELYLQGYTWPQIREKTGNGWTEFSHQLAKYPDLVKAYQEARRASGQTMEDKALTLAEQLVSANKFTGTQVRAHEVAMNQYRWSAARRDPAGFAEAGAAKISVVVPVQINSSLNLGQEGSKETKTEETIWEAHASVLERASDADLGPESPDIVDVLEEGGYEIAFDIPAAAPKGAPPAYDDDPGVESSPEDPEIAPSGLPVALEAVRERLGLPLEAKAVVERRPSPGRLPKKHKTARQTGGTRTAYAKMHKSPSVAAALAKKDDTDGTA